MREYRLNYYEDDVVIYTARGKYPKLPDKRKQHIFYFGKYKHVLKSFYTKKHAEVAVSFAKRKSYWHNHDKLVAFYCNECCMWHIVSESNYDKYLKKRMK